MAVSFSARYRSGRVKQVAEHRQPRDEERNVRRRLGGQGGASRAKVSVRHKGISDEQEAKCGLWRWTSWVRPCLGEDGAAEQERIEPRSKFQQVLGKHHDAERDYQASEDGTELAGTGR